MTGSENDIEVLTDALRFLEALKAAGITAIPVKKASSPPQPLSSEVRDDAWSAKEGFEAGSSIVFGLWKIGGALFVAGRLCSGETPFPEDESVQAQKLLGWFAGEIKADAGGGPLILSATVAKDGADMTGGALAVKPLIDTRIAAWKPSIIVALGPLAALILAGSMDTGKLRGRFHSYDDVKIAVTHSPEDLVKRPGLKKETLEDMKTVIRALA